MSKQASVSFRTAALAALLGLLGCAQAQEGAVRISPPAFDEAQSRESAVAVAVVAGGCFWGVQGVYQHVTGVLKAVSGYAGGARETAKYELVGNGDTGHAETVQILYDPAQITYGTLLQIYFSVVHDPTQLNRQGPDHGPQYRSTIFPVDDEQHEIAARYIAQLEAEKVFRSKIVTTLEDGRAFYAAEAYHQDFLARNPTYPYIVINDLPKVRDLAALFPDVYRSEPVLVLPKPARRGG
jgi:peptide-methionine (S)-S-oxide reductase